MIKDHKTFRRILQRAFPEAMEEMKKAWDGKEDKQKYLDENVTWKSAPVTAAQIEAKEDAYNMWIAGSAERQKEFEVRELLNDTRLKAFFKVAAERFGLTSVELEAAIKSKM